MRILKYIKKIDKRLILVFAIFGVMTFAYFQKPHTVSSNQFSNFDEKRALYNRAVASIKSGSGWKPVGWGSGDYITTIPTIKAGAVIDLDNGNVIWSMNLKQKTATASLSKLATVMTALDIYSPDKVLTVSEDASEQIPTKLGLTPGEKLTLSEAI